MGLLIKFKHANTSEGGVLSIANTDIQTGIPYDFLPEIDDETRLAGWIIGKKGFVKNESDDMASGVYLIISRLTEGEDRILIHSGTEDDVWDDAEEYPTGPTGPEGDEWYGAGDVAEAIEIGDSEFYIESEYEEGFHDGDVIFLLNRVTNTWERLTLDSVEWDWGASGPTGPTGPGFYGAKLTATGVTENAYPVKEKATMQGTGTEAFSLSGKYLTLLIDGKYTATVEFTTETTAAEVAETMNTALGDYLEATASAGKVRIDHLLYYYHHYFKITAGDALTELGFDTNEHRGCDGSIIAAGLLLGDIKPEIVSVDTSGVVGDGEYDNSNYPILPDPVGTVDDVLTLTFEDDETYSISSVNHGTIATDCKTSEDVSPAHGSGVYCTIYSAGFSGTFAEGDTIVVTTAASAEGFWLENIGEADCERISPNRCGLKAIYRF